MNSDSYSDYELLSQREYKRYAPCLCIKHENKYYPYWDLTHTSHEDRGEGFYIKGITKPVYSVQLIECYWDLKNKHIVFGDPIDSYPDKTEFVKDEKVVVEDEKNHWSVNIDQIVDIEYKTYDSTIIKIEKLLQSELELYFKAEQLSTLNKKAICEIRHWEPSYVLKSGRVVKGDYRLKHIV